MRINHNSYYSRRTEHHPYGIRRGTDFAEKEAPKVTALIA
jgi:hypothetical protein